MPEGKDDDDKKKPAGFLQQISMFKDPIPTDFGGILTALLPVIVLLYAFYIVYITLTIPPPPIKTIKINQNGDKFFVDVSCVASSGCVVIDPEDTELQGFKTIKYGETIPDYQLTFSNTAPSLYVSPMKCWFGSNKTSCQDKGAVVALDEPDIYKDVRNQSKLPEYPLKFTIKNEATAIKGGPAWAASVQFTSFTDNSTQVTEIYVNFTGIFSNKKQATDLFRKDNSYSVQDPKAFYDSVCEPNFLESGDCSDPTVLNQKKKRAFVMPLFIDSDYIQFFKIPLQPQVVIMEVVGKIGGTYTLIVSALKAIHILFLYATGKIKTKDMASMMKENFGGD